MIDQPPTLRDVESMLWLAARMVTNDKAQSRFEAAYFVVKRARGLLHHWAKMNPPKNALEHSMLNIAGPDDVNPMTPPRAEQAPGEDYEFGG